MITTLLITHHEKALKYLNLIEKAKTVNEWHKAYILKLENVEFWHPYKKDIPKHVERVKINAAIIERLQNGYTALMQKMNYQIVSKSIAA